MVCATPARAAISRTEMSVIGRVAMSSVAALRMASRLVSASERPVGWGVGRADLQVSMSLRSHRSVCDLYPGPRREGGSRRTCVGRSTRCADGSGRGGRPPGCCRAGVRSRWRPLPESEPQLDSLFPLVSTAARRATPQLFGGPQSGVADRASIRAIQGMTSSARRPVAQGSGHELHGLVDVGEERLVAGAQVVQTGLAVGVGVNRSLGQPPWQANWTVQVRQ